MRFASMPASVPAKAKYLFGDCKLWARLYDVPLSFPKIFPINSVLALRCACAAEALGRQPAFALAVMRAYWADGADISQPQVLQALAEGLGIDGAALLVQAQSQAVKDLLRANTDDAVKRNVFGAPTFFVGEQMFWGNDRLQLLEAFVGGKLAA